MKFYLVLAVLLLSQNSFSATVKAGDCVSYSKYDYAPVKFKVVEFRDKMATLEQLDSKEQSHFPESYIQSSSKGFSVVSCPK